MDASRFDALAKGLAARRSRRAALKRGGAGLGAALLGAVGFGTRAGAQEATPEASPGAGDEDRTFFLFVQTATGGSFRPNPSAGTPEAEGTPTPGGGADYLLTLEGHHGETIYFSDRPQRIFGEAPTQQFLEGLGFSPANPPNAALVAQTDQGDDVVVLELVEPTYDAGASTVTYGANILSEYQGEGLTHVAAQQQDAALPEQFGQASLFIDDCPNLTGCLLVVPITPIPVYMGALPGGSVGQCWSWSSFSCSPCNGQSVSFYNDLCNSAYPECNGICFAV